MTPEAVVAKLAEIVVSLSQFSEEEVYIAMAGAGIPDPVANRAYNLTQTAWGRALLTPMGVQFSPDYACFNAEGVIVETGRLAEEPYFAAAAALASQYARSQGFRELAARSAEFDAVNQALNNGSKPENLAMTATFLFLEPPTEAGVEQAKRAMATHLAALRKTGSEKVSVYRAQTISVS